MLSLVMWIKELKNYSLTKQLFCFFCIWEFFVVFFCCRSKCRVLGDYFPFVCTLRLRRILSLWCVRTHQVYILNRPSWKHVLSVNIFRKHVLILSEFVFVEVGVYDRNPASLCGQRIELFGQIKINFRSFHSNDFRRVVSEFPAFRWREPCKPSSYCWLERFKLRQ